MHFVTGFFVVNMGCYQVVLFVTLTLVLQCHQLLANNCNRRTTFVQIRIPQRTTVSIKYPKEINPVQFVPFPYNPSGSECIKCQGKTCNKCTYTKSSKPSSTTNARTTNIIIDIRGTRKINETTSETTSKNYNNTSETVDGTIVGIYDKTWAASKSGATANAGDKGNSSAATAAGTSLSQSDVLAALNEEEINKSNGETKHVEDIFAISEDVSTANASSSSSATKDGSPDSKSPESDSVKNKSDSVADDKNTPSVQNGAATAAPAENPASPDSNSPGSDSVKNKSDSVADDKNTPAVQNGAATAAPAENPASPDSNSPGSDSVKNKSDSVADDKNTPAVQNGAGTAAPTENPA